MGSDRELLEASLEKDSTLGPGVGAARPAVTEGLGTLANRLEERMFALREGTRLGRYELRKCIGIGGLGAVYEAFDPELDRRVAIKILHASGTEASQRRLMREARVVARLKHPNVVTLYEIGRHDDLLFVVMELVEGEDLRKWAQRVVPTTAGWKEIVEAYVQAGRGLAAAHRAGVVHADFKPHNLLIDHDGRVRVADFGLSRLVEGGDVEADEDVAFGTPSEATVPTRGSRFAGTPAYMAPEQRAGETATAASDQYSFCVALYQTLYGRLPGEASPSSTPKVPAWLQQIVTRGLHVDPAARWPSMDALVDTLEATPRRRRRNALLAGGLLTVTGAVLATLAIARLLTPDPCAPVEAAAERLWAPRRDVVAAALRAIGLPQAEELWASLDGALTSYQARLEATVAEVCATTSEGSRSSRLSCLDERIQQANTLIELLTQADATFAERSLDAVDGLPAPSTCTDPHRIRALPEPPSDPVVAASVEELRPLVLRTAVFQDTGRYKEGLTLIDEAIPRIEETGYEPLLAEARYYRGWILAQLWHRDEAIATLEESLRIAIRSRHDIVAARAASLLLQHKPEQDREALETSYGRAEALALRLGPDSLELAHLWNDWGALLNELGDHEGAVHQLSKALALKHRLIGSDNTDVARSRNNLAFAYTGMGLPDKAIPELEAVQEYYLRVWSRHGHLGHAAINRAEAHEVEGERSTAVTWYRNAFQYVKSDDDIVGTSAHVGLCRTLTAVGELDQAAHHCDEGIRRVERVAANRALMAEALAPASTLAAALGQRELTLSRARRALEILALDPGVPLPRASVLEQLARTLVDHPEHRAEALRLAEEARAIFSTIGHGRVRDAERVQAFIAAHTGGSTRAPSAK